MKIIPAIPDDRNRLLDIWLRSVRATHSFLTENDIQSLLPHVREYLASESEFWVLTADDGDLPRNESLLGFMGLAGNQLESLFLAPEFHRRGGGRQLVRHAQARASELTVDVNEQNETACSFYVACGFKVTGRSDVDRAGRPFPLVHLKWVRE